MSFFRSGVLAVAMTFAASVPALAQSSEPRAGSLDCTKAFFQCYYINGRDLVSCTLELGKCLAGGSSVALPVSRDH